MRLRQSNLSGPGFTRKRRGKGFSFYGSDGTPLTDEAALQRIKDLVIPPAWKKVWISPRAGGHIQAVGTDAAGRKQYLYHQQWQEERAEEKFDRVLEMSTRLPDFRAQVAADLAGRGLKRDRVLALALHLFDRGYFRAGGEQYAEEHESYGLATLLCEHVKVHGDVVEFDYPAKSGVQRTLEVEDPDVAKVIRARMRATGCSTRLLTHQNASEWTDLHADDLNARFKELVGDDYSVKDLRTWHGTVLAAEAFVGADPAVDPKVVKRVVSAVMKEVSGALGNTPAVARASYVDPRVIKAYEGDDTIAPAVKRAQRSRTEVDRQAVLEKATRAMIKRASRSRSTAEPSDR